MYITNPVRWNSILTFQEQSIVETQEYSLVIDRQHTLPEAFLIVQSINPAMKMILHLHSTTSDSFTNGVQWRIIISITETILPLINTWQAHIQQIKNFLPIQITKISFEITPQIEARPCCYRIPQIVQIMTILVGLHAPEPAVRRRKTSSQ